MKLAFTVYGYKDACCVTTINPQMRTKTSVSRYLLKKVHVLYALDTVLQVPALAGSTTRRRRHEQVGVLSVPLQIRDTTAVRLKFLVYLAAIFAYSICDESEREAWFRLGQVVQTATVYVYKTVLSLVWRNTCNADPRHISSVIGVFINSFTFSLNEVRKSTP